MLDNWLSPLKNKALLTAKYNADQLGARILRHTVTEGMPDLSGVQIGLIGLRAAASDPIRAHLYRFCDHFPTVSLADLGNLRKPGLDFSIGALAEIRAAGILPVLLGDDLSFAQALYRALRMNYASINMTIADERVPLDPEQLDAPDCYMNPITLSGDSRILQLGLIGYQRHFVPPRVQQFIQDQHYDILRLGMASGQLPETEPIIRNADLFGINVSVLRSGQMPGVLQASPSGFTVEEACQLAYYAGISDKLKGFYLLGYAPAEERRGQSAMAIAEMLWYFLDGFYQRKGDYPVALDGLMEYIVELKRYDYQLTFWKSKLSGRWWIQVPVQVRQRDLRHRLIPCSYEDYKRSLNDELPDRLINAFKRFA